MSPSARPAAFAVPARRELHRAGLAPALALGAMLARRGPLAVVSMAVSILTVLGLVVLAFVLGRRGGDAPVSSVPVLASSAIVWGGAFLQAVAVSAGALRRDRAEGVRHLFVARTTTLRGYLVARVGGLAVVLAVIAGGGTLLVSIVAALASAQTHALVLTLRATFASVLYAVIFAIVIAPVAFATLGSRTRLGGYLALVLVLVLPELVVGALGSRLPSEVAEVCAIPSALAAVRSALSVGSFDALRLFRALVALGAFGFGASLFVRRDAGNIESEEP